MHYFQMGLQFPFFGVPVVVSWGTIILFALILFDSIHYIRRQYPSSKFGYAVAGTIATALTFVSLAIHELCHALKALAFNVKITQAGFMFFGAYVEHGKLDGLPPYVGMLIALAGPASNFVLAGLAAIIVWIFGESLGENTIQYVSYINWRLGKWNLLPIAVFDGGHALLYFLMIFMSGKTAGYVLSATTFLTIYLYVRGSGRRSEETEEEQEDGFERALERL